LIISITLKLYNIRLIRTSQIFACGDEEMIRSVDKVIRTSLNIGELLSSKLAVYHAIFDHGAFQLDRTFRLWTNREEEQD